MENQKSDVDCLEVTVEVVPQTVKEIVYLSEDLVMASDSPAQNPHSEEEEELDQGEAPQAYEIGSVDPTRLKTMSLVLDESESFVLLSQDDCESQVNNNVGYIIDTVDSSKDDLAEEWNNCEFECPYCTFKYYTLEDLTEHLAMHEVPAKPEHVCKVCGETFERAQALSLHFKLAHPPPHLICNICECPCVSEAALLMHLKKHEPKAFSCETCGAEYDNAVSLNNHMKTHVTTLLFACSKCDAGFSSTSEISVHLRTVHGNEQKMGKVVTVADSNRKRKKLQ